MKVGPSAFFTCGQFWKNKFRPAKQVPRWRGRVWLAWLVSWTQWPAQAVADWRRRRRRGKPVPGETHQTTWWQLQNIKSCQNYWLVNSLSLSKILNSFQTLGCAGKTKFAGKPVPSVEIGNSSLDRLLAALPNTSHFPLMEDLRSKRIQCMTNGHWP